MKMKLFVLIVLNLIYFATYSQTLDSIIEPAKLIRVSPEIIEPNVWRLNVSNEIVLFLKSDPQYNRTCLEMDGQVIDYPFYIIEPYLGEVFVGIIQQDIYALLVQSWDVGTSGIEASRLNVGLIITKENSIYSRTSFNSYFRGHEGVYLKPKSFEISTLGFLGYSHNRKPIVSVNRFKFEDNKWSLIEPIWAGEFYGDSIKHVAFPQGIPNPKFPVTKLFIK